MARQLTSADLLITRIEGKTYAYIKPEIGDFAATHTVTGVSVKGVVDHKVNPLFVRAGDVYVEGVSAYSARIGLKVEGAADVRVYDYKFSDTVNQTFASAIKRDDGHTGSAEFLRVYADGKDRSANGTFDPNFNTDFFDNNNNQSAKGGAVFFRDVTAKNFYDAAFDAKSDVYIMNATINGTTTGLRTWYGNDIYIVNSEIIGGANSFLAKFTGGEGKIYHYNTTWNGKDRPDLSEITTWQVPLSQASSVKKNNIIELTKNPLPAIDPFFTVDNAKYFLQVSVNGGAWRNLDVPNNGFLSDHVGDTLIDLSNLGSGSYRLRAWTVENGRESAPVVSDGFSVSGNGGIVRDDSAPPAPTPDPAPDDGETPDEPVQPPTAVDGVVVTGSRKNAAGGFDIVGGNGDEVFITSAGSDRITTGHGHDLIVFDTTKDIGDDVIFDFNRGRDKLLFTEYVDLGCNGVRKLDGSGRFVLDDPALNANGGTIALGSDLAGRFIHYTGETEDGLFVYETWNRPWSEVPKCDPSPKPAESAPAPAIAQDGLAPVVAQDSLAPMASTASRENFVFVGGRGDDLILTTAGDDRITTGDGHDLILFDTRQDIGDDIILDFNRGRDKLLFTEFVNLGADTVHRLDGSGRFVLDDPELGVDGGTIALGSDLAGRYIHYTGETDDGLFVYETWKRPWDEIPS